jgi:hypothetical protein
MWITWPEPKSVTEVRRFLGEIQYWRRFIPNLSFIETPLHALTSVKNTFQWEGKQQKTFNILKENISITPILALSESSTDHLRSKMDASGLCHGCSIDTISISLFATTSETFNSTVVVNYPTYDKEMYALVQSMKEMEALLVMGKETIIHTYH